MSLRSRLRRPSPALVIALVALFVVLGGTATAASLINGKRIKPGTITAKQIKKSTITSDRIKNGTLTRSDLSSATVNALRGATGPAGPAGPAGPQGAAGPQGPAGIVAAQSTQVTSVNLPANATTTVASLPVPAGKYAVQVALSRFQIGDDIVGCEAMAGAVSIGESRWRPAGPNLTSPMAIVGVTPAGTSSIAVRCSTAASAGAASEISVVALPVS
jgi:hypothetical protein